MIFKRLLLVNLLAVSVVAGQSILDNLLSPSRLPFLKSSKLIQISSNDTTGGNDDFIIIPAGATARLADIQGPGVITMFWATIASSDKYFLRHIVLRMYWDGEKYPSVEVPIGDFFGTGFQYKQYITPFIGMSSGGYYCYFPMPFNVSARVDVTNETGRLFPHFIITSTIINFQRHSTLQLRIFTRRGIGRSVPTLHTIIRFLKRKGKAILWDST